MQYQFTMSARMLGSIAQAALLVGLAAVAAPAQAEEAATARGGSQDGEIVVTATRAGAVSVEKVPLAMSVINIENVTRAGQGNLSDLGKFDPSLSITESAPGFNKFNMRGLATGGYRTSDTSDRSLVAVYLDDTPISLQGQTPDLKVYDLERVEVLRGPQGTLYGAGSMAGTVRFVTAKPKADAFFGSAEAGAAITEHGAGSYNGRLMINLPLVKDVLAVRANGYIGRDGGYIDNVGAYAGVNRNANTTKQARVALRWTPSTAFTLDAAFTYEHSSARGLNIGMSGLSDYTTFTNGPEGTRDNFRLYQISGDYDLGGVHLIVSGAHTDREIGYVNSTEATIGYFFQSYGAPVTGNGTYPLYNAPTSFDPAVSKLIPYEQYTINQRVRDSMVEARLASDNNGPVRWTLGMFWEKQARHLVQDIPVAGFDTLSYQNAFYGPYSQTSDGLYNSQTVDSAFQPNDIFSGLQDTNERQIAVFGDATWHLTHRLDLSAGLRWFDFHQTYYLFEGGTYGVVNNVPLTQNAYLKSSGVNPRFNVSWTTGRDSIVYAEAAKGFRYGNANQPVPIGDSGIAQTCKNNLGAYGYSSAPATFGPDKLWSYTLGQKAKLAGGKVTLNTDAFFIDWRDVQTRLLLDCSYFFTDNKGTIHSKGIEVEATAKLTHKLTIGGYVSFTDARASGNIPTVGAFDGNQVPYSPRWKTSATLFYDTPLAGGQALHAQLSYRYQSAQFTTFNPQATSYSDGVLTATGASSTYARIPQQHDVSASLAWDFGSTEVGIYGNNLVDGVRIVDVQRATYYKVYQPGDRVAWARPRTIGVRLRQSF
ncbi:TonB-dependent receptor [Novosphingobium nitrogenifigens DSM 19370]|uniref:TonB-dependent receptor n=1 Tax=Novosphingobium nitrogenifigens DSM 19370 TaxID=983920 RepID=F1ZAG4_9SPHN|nr:TonB-dependent receptor [Novosphingobium nitrogenifigens]EGD58428.1 TonB-dependent receptor [Novosphingobium nitrogenifigens DSM 19370]